MHGVNGASRHTVGPTASTTSPVHRGSFSLPASAPTTLYSRAGSPRPQQTTTVLSSPPPGSMSSVHTTPSIRASSPTMVVPSQPQHDPVLQAEIRRRLAAEARVVELEELVSTLREQIVSLEGPTPQREIQVQRKPEEHIDDPVDAAICEYLERNPDFPVSIQKVAPNYYVFGDRGTVYVTQRGEHIVVRVGGGFKSLQVFMDERSLMVTN